MFHYTTVLGTRACPCCALRAAQGPPSVGARPCPRPSRTRRGRPLSRGRCLRNGRAEEGKAPKISELTGTNNYPGSTWLSRLSATAGEKPRCHHLRLAAPSGPCCPPRPPARPRSWHRVAGPGVPEPNPNSQTRGWGEWDPGGSWGPPQQAGSPKVLPRLGESASSRGGGAGQPGKLRQLVGIGPGDGVKTRLGCRHPTAACLSVCPSVHPPIPPSAHPFTCLSIHPYLCPSTPLSVCPLTTHPPISPPAPSLRPSFHPSIPSLCPSTHPSVRPSTHPSVYLLTSPHPSIRLSICLSICLSGCPSTRPSICLSAWRPVRHPPPSQPPRPHSAPTPQGHFSPGAPPPPRPKAPGGCAWPRPLGRGRGRLGGGSGVAPPPPGTPKIG